MNVTIKPKTKHAREVIERKGDEWTVLEKRDSIIAARDGPRYALESKDKQYLMWVLCENDPNYEIIS